MRKVYYNSIVPRLFLWGKMYKTAMFFGFICTKRPKAEPLSPEAINHEAIHVEQYGEVTAVAIVLALALSLVFGWGAWPFILALTAYYIIYIVEAGISWVHNFFAHRKKNAAAVAKKAYRNSMFEMEAYAHAGDPGYIPVRKSFQWLRNFGVI